MRLSENMPNHTQLWLRLPLINALAPQTRKAGYDFQRVNALANDKSKKIHENFDLLTKAEWTIFLWNKLIKPGEVEVKTYQTVISALLRDLSTILFLAQLCGLTLFNSQT